MSSLFYLVAIVMVMVSPLIVPISVSILHAVRGFQQRTAVARPAIAGAVRPAFAPAFAGAVPAVA
jgi:hypothetical protein